MQQSSGISCRENVVACHCAIALVIANEAKQSIVSASGQMDCFVAEPVIGPRFADPLASRNDGHKAAERSFRNRPVALGSPQNRAPGDNAMQQETPQEQFDFAAMVADLNSLLRLKTTVIGIKMFARVEDMEAIPKIRRPNAVHTTDQIVSMASRLGWTVGITGDDLVGAQCRAVIGLGAQDEKWLEGANYVGVWHGTAEDARKRQEALDVVPFGRYQAMAVSPLTSGRLDPPDICLVYATPGQMIILINGLQYTGYKKFEWGVVGETACADSWGRALKTGEPSLSLPCFAERRYGGVPDEEMLMALQPSHLAKAITGMKQLAKNGLRYPIAPYGIQSDVRAGMGVSYGKK
jgi:uncharacterized protein (DUF169 family)